ncbi:MAG: helix-turn-helix domain-containing protein [Methanomassiliicoccales archaeon]|jgi:transposase InsO family protein
MTTPNGYAVRYDIKGEPRKFRYGSQQLQDFIHLLRREAVLLAEEEGVKKVAEKIRCCPRSVRNWITRWKKGGFVALLDKSRRPRKTHNLEREKVDMILGIRDRQGYGCSKIVFDVECSSSTVHKYLKIHARPMRHTTRRRFRTFERKHSNSLWQMDYTQLRKDVWVLQVVDDHSRFIIAAKVMWSPDGRETISTFGVPEQFLTNHGTQFYSVKGGESSFDQFCQEWAVQHILESIAHPQTLGKTEQRHNMMKNYLWQDLPDLDLASRDAIKEAVHDWVNRHNFDSPHEGWLTYRIGDWVKKKRIHFLPYLRFVCHQD